MKATNNPQGSSNVDEQIVVEIPQTDLTAQILTEANPDLAAERSAEDNVRVVSKSEAKQLGLPPDFYEVEMTDVELRPFRPALRLHAKKILQLQK